MRWLPPDVLSLSLRTGCAPAPAATPRLRPTAEESDPISATWANGVLPREGTGRLNSGTSLRQLHHARPLPKRHSEFQRPGSGSWWPRPDLKKYFSFHSLVLWTCFLPASMRGLRPPVWPLSRLPRVPGTPQTHDADVSWTLKACSKRLLQNSLRHTSVSGSGPPGGTARAGPAPARVSSELPAGTVQGARKAGRAGGWLRTAPVLCAVPVRPISRQSRPQRPRPTTEEAVAQCS